MEILLNMYDNVGLCCVGSVCDALMPISLPDLRGLCVKRSLKFVNLKITENMKQVQK
jgi:hypothetical protein